MSIGLTLPYAQSTSSLGFLAGSTTQIEATYYNIKSLLLTDWGERPNQFYMGCNLTEFLFQPANSETQDAIDERIRSQLSKWLPYVSVDSIDITLVEEQQIHVRMQFSIRGRSDLNNAIDVTITQSGG